MILEVYYQDEVLIGKLAQAPASAKVYFQFEAGWLKRGIELSPLHLPLSLGLGLVGQHQQRNVFQGLFGLFGDSLPQGWGRRLMNRRLALAGINPFSAGSLVRLGFLGERAMGALSFRPDADETADSGDSGGLAEADQAALQFEEDEASEGSLKLLAAGLPPGGARPKVLALVQDDRVRLGAELCSDGEPWLIKLSEANFAEAGRLEFAYSKMAAAAGLCVPPSRLFEGRLFGTKRFDRQGTRKVHVHSLGGLLQAADGSYEDLARMALRLSGDHRDLREIVRRAAFNVGALIRDDHLFNVSFLMDERGRWSLAPAFDLTPNDPARIARAHAMTVNGRDRPQARDLHALADELGVRDATDLLEQVREAVDRWPEFAAMAGVSSSVTRALQRALDPSPLAGGPAASPKKPKKARASPPEGLGSA